MSYEERGGQFAAECRRVEDDAEQMGDSVAVVSHHIASGTAKGFAGDEIDTVIAALYRGTLDDCPAWPKVRSAIEAEIHERAAAAMGRRGAA